MEESTTPKVADGASSLPQTGALFNTFDGSAETTQGPTSDHINETTSVLLTQQLCWVHNLTQHSSVKGVNFGWLYPSVQVIYY